MEKKIILSVIMIMTIIVGVSYASIIINVSGSINTSASGGFTGVGGFCINYPICNYSTTSLYGSCVRYDVLNNTCLGTLQNTLLKPVNTTTVITSSTSIITTTIPVKEQEAINSYTGISLPIWTSARQVRRNEWLVNVMPDSFDNHIHLNASVPITVQVLTLGNYKNFPVEDNYTESYNSTGIGNSINFWFNESVGCGDYVYIILPSGGNLIPFNITPNITATYKPTINTTGECKYE